MDSLNLPFNKKKITFANDLCAKDTMLTADFLIPDYQHDCLSNLVPHLLFNIVSFSDQGRIKTTDDEYDAFIKSFSLKDQGEKRIRFDEDRNDSALAMIPASAQYVLLVLDGLGYEQLISRIASTSALGAMDKAVISSVAPTTTSTALSSITTAKMPSEHGVLGYRVKIPDNDVLNVLQWRSKEHGSNHGLEPTKFQHYPAFLGYQAPVVSRNDYNGTGFSKMHLAGGVLHSYRVPSSMITTTRNLLEKGKKFIYLYYPGIDTVAHEYGLGKYYDQELKFADYLVAALLECLPKNATLVVTADHGQVEVTNPPLEIPKDILELTTLLSGEGRFRWLHVKKGLEERVREMCAEVFGDVAVIATARELEDMGLFGGHLTDEYRSRIGDVALVATEPVAFFDPEDTGEFQLVSRHGAMTGAEALVPLLSYAAT